MKLGFTFLLVCFVSVLVTCDGNKPVPAVPEKKSSFQRQVFTQPFSGAAISLVSETECEINAGNNILLAEYTRQDNKLRVVMRLSGSGTVVYYEIAPDGLRDPKSNEVYLLPEPLKKVQEQIRVAREAGEARDRAAKAEQERIRRMEAEREERKKEELHKKFMAMRDSAMSDMKKFFQNGTVIKGLYTNYVNTSNLTPSYEVTITDEIKFSAVEQDPYNQTFEVSGHMRSSNGKDAAVSSSDIDAKESDGKFFGQITIQSQPNRDMAQISISCCFRLPPYNNTVYKTAWDENKFESRGGGSNPVRYWKE